MRDGAEWNDLSLRRPYVHVLQIHWRLPELRSDLQDYVVLIDRRIHGRNLRLSEGFIERIVDHLRRYAHPRCSGPVIRQSGLKTAVLLIGVDVGEDRYFSHLLQEHRPPIHQILNVIALNGVLILGAARTPADTKVLPRLQESIRARRREFGAQTVDHLVGVGVALIERLQAHVYKTA